MKNWQVLRLILIIISSVLWTLLAQFDPFGIKTATSIQSENIILRLIGGPYYHPAPNWFKDEVSAQEKITVVLIDNQYIEKTKQRWPMSYRQHEFLLNDILDLGPRAIFYDIFFQFNHDSLSTDKLNQFVDTIEDRGKEISVFIPRLVSDIGSTGSCDLDVPYVDTKEVDQLVAKTIFDDEPYNLKLKGVLNDVYVGWEGCGRNRYPSFIMHNKKLITPAFALFQEVCDTEKNYSIDGCKNLRTDKLDDIDNFKLFKNPMMVRWGSGVSKNHQLLFKDSQYGKNCEVYDSMNPFDKTNFAMVQLGYMFEQALSSKKERGKAERCTYTDTLHATWFIEPPTEELYEHMKDMIKDRVVLIGTQIDAVNDYILSPVHDNVPGVYLHAMALDNYLEYGSEYFKPMSHFQYFILELLFVIFGNIICFLFLEKYCRSAIFDFISRKFIIITSGTFLVVLLWWHGYSSISLLYNPIFWLFVLVLVILVIIRNSLEISLVLIGEPLISFIIRIIVFSVMGGFVGTMLWWARFAPMDWAGILLISFLAYPPWVLGSWNKEDKAKAY